jgi:hypothetical protein
MGGRLGTSKYGVYVRLPDGTFNPEYKQRAYAANRDKRNARQRDKRDKVAVNQTNYQLREQTLNAYGGQCVACGEIDYDVLTIDHINNDGSKERSRTGKVRLGGSTLYRKLRKLGFPRDRYQLLCCNCNWRKHLRLIRNRNHAQDH